MRATYWHAPLHAPASKQQRPAVVVNLRHARQPPRKLHLPQRPSLRIGQRKIQGSVPAVQAPLRRLDIVHHGLPTLDLPLKYPRMRLRVYPDPHPVQDPEIGIFGITRKHTCIIDRTSLPSTHKIWGVSPHLNLHVVVKGVQAVKVASTVFDLLISGKLGNVVGGRARGNIRWLRGRVTPANPQTSFQSVVRNALSSGASLWKNTLSQAQRDAWDNYAASVLKNGLSLTGENWFVASEALRLQANQYLTATPWTQVLAGPTVLSQAALTAPVPTVDASDDQASIAFTVADAWNAASGPGQSGLLVWASPGVSPSRQVNNRGFLFAGALQCEAPALTTPQVLDLPFDYAAGDRVFLRFRSRLADGRFSPLYETQTIAVA